MVQALSGAVECAPVGEGIHLQLIDDQAVESRAGLVDVLLTHMPTDPSCDGSGRACQSA